MATKDNASITLANEKDVDSSKNSVTFSQEEKQDTIYIDPEVEKSIRKKYDRIVLPMVTLLYLLAFICRTNMGNARNLGLTDDIEFAGNDFSISLTTFFITYVLCEIPINILAKKFGPKISLSAIGVSFGIVTMCTAFCTNFAGIAVARLFLGIAEAGIMPGISYMLSTLYRRHELVTRVGIYASFSSLAGAFGGLLAIGFSKIPKWGMIETWRNIFLFEGIITIVVSIIAYFVLPTSPQTAYFLTEEERVVAIQRIKIETLSNDQHHLKPIHFRLAMRNLNTYLMSIGLFCSLLCMNSIALFMPSLLATMGFDTIKSQLMTVPPYVFGTICCISASVISDKFKVRGPIMICFAGPFVIIAFIILLACENYGARYFAIFLATAGAFTGSPLMVAWMVDNSSGPMVRAIASAFNISLGSIGGLVATWTYLATDAPKYTKGHAVNLAMGAVVMIAAAAGSLNLKLENKKRDEGKRDHVLEGLTEEEIGELGHSHPNFRYTI